MLKAVVTGVAGQDGSYLAELLLDKGYQVHGVSRRKSVSKSLENIEGILNHRNFFYTEGDLSDSTFISRLVYNLKPHEFYNLGAQSHVGHSFLNPMEAFRINAESVIMHLSHIKDLSPSTRYYQASTSEIMGGVNCPNDGYDESFRPNPRSPYAVAKAAAHFTVKNYREAYGIFSCSGLLFNHSSKRRGRDFATRKITDGVARVALGIENKVRMGNFSAFRDEGCSKDYVRAMWLMLQQDSPDDYVIATGSGATIEDMFRYVCGLANINFEDVYEMDERFMRPSDVPYLLGNPSKAVEVLGWHPEYTWKALLEEMYKNDLKLLLKSTNI